MTAMKELDSHHLQPCSCCLACLTVHVNGVRHAAEEASIEFLAALADSKSLLPLASLQAALQPPDAKAKLTAATGNLPTI